MAGSGTAPPPSRPRFPCPAATAAASECVTPVKHGASGADSCDASKNHVFNQHAHRLVKSPPSQFSSAFSTAPFRARHSASRCGGGGRSARRRAALAAGARAARLLVLLSPGPWDRREDERERKRAAHKQRLALRAKKPERERKAAAKQRARAGAERRPWERKEDEREREAAAQKQRQRRGGGVRSLRRRKLAPPGGRWTPCRTERRGASGPGLENYRP